MRNDIGEALSFDPLDYAEKLTGKSYKTDDATESLGVGLHILHGQHKSELLRAAGDTYWAQPMPDWIAVVESLGFRLLHQEDIPGTDDKYRIWWNEDGLLLVADSYWGDKSVNSSKVYFNYRGPRGEMFRCSSGFAGEIDGESVWCGDKDAREGLRYALERMRASGSFVSPWVKCGFLWLLHYQDTEDEGYDFKAINARRIALLPEHVRTAMNYEAGV